MFKYILVPATGADSDAPVYATALAIARLCRSHLEFLHVRIDVRQTLVAMAGCDMTGGIDYDQIFESLEQDVAERQRRAKRAFLSFCQRESLPITSDSAPKLLQLNGG